MTVAEACGSSEFTESAELFKKLFSSGLVGIVE